MPQSPASAFPVGSGCCQGLQASRPVFVNGVRASRSRTKVCVWFQDDARFGQQRTLSSALADKMSRPSVVRQNRRKSIWVFGIVDPVTGWSMISPHREANTPTMQQFLKAAANKLGPRHRVVIVVDRAAWHTAKQLKCPRRITPLFVPLRSLELSPAEWFRLSFREHHWSNRLYPDEPSLIHEARNSHCQPRRKEVRSSQLAGSHARFK